MDDNNLYVIFNVPKRATNLFKMGDVFEQAGNYPSACACYLEAMEEEYTKEAPPAFITYNIANNYKKLGNYQVSIKFYSAAIKSIEKDKLKMGEIPGKQLHCSILLNMGNTLNILKNYMASVGCFAKAKDLDPTHAPHYVGLGWNLTQLKETQSALSVYEEGLQKCGEDSMIRFNLGGLYYNLGENEKALECFKKCVEINPLDTEAQTMVETITKQV